MSVFGHVLFNLLVNSGMAFVLTLGIVYATLRAFRFPAGRAGIGRKGALLRAHRPARHPHQPRSRKLRRQATSAGLILPRLFASRHGTVAGSQRADSAALNAPIESPKPAGEGSRVDWGLDFTSNVRHLT